MLVCGLITRQTYSVVQDSWLRFQLFFEKVTCFQLRDTVSIRPKHEKECGWYLCFLFFYFYKGMIVDRTNSDQEMASTDMQGECERPEYLYRRLGTHRSVGELIQISDR